MSLYGPAAIPRRNRVGTPVGESTVAFGYRILNRELELPAEPVLPARFLPRFISDLGLPQAVEQRARALLDDEETPDVHSAKPASVAGGAILTAVSEVGIADVVKQVDVAEVTGVSVLTVRRYSDELRSM